MPIGTYLALGAFTTSTVTSTTASTGLVGAGEHFE